MDEELVYATKNGYEFTTNLWCFSEDPASPIRVMYTAEEVTWAAEEHETGIYFIWDGQERSALHD